MTTIRRARHREALLAGFEGDVLEPGEPSFESARAATLVPGRPDRILRPRSDRDVQLAVRFAVESGSAIAVRGGGHSFAGLSSGDGTVIDLAELRDVDVLDPDRGTVRVGGGATWGEVSDALRPFDLAISAGDTRSVGVGGLTLGGGIGWKVRRYGLALDNLQAAGIVTADGALVRTSATEAPDLFWAVRGGGGNLGVVAWFEFRAHRTTRIHFGRIAIQSSDRAAVLRGWADWLHRAPDALTSVANLANPLAGGPDAPVEILVAVDDDDPDSAARAVDPLRRLGAVVADDVSLVPYDEILEAGGAPPSGIAFVVRSGFVESASVGPVVDRLADAAGRAGSPFISVRALGGAIARVPRSATAFAHRSAELMVTTISAGPAPVVEAARPDVDELWRTLTPFTSGAYANFLDSASADDVAAVYPRDSYDRLAAVKDRYDPRNVFRRAHNVPPRGPR